MYSQYGDTVGVGQWLQIRSVEPHYAEPWDSQAMVQGLTDLKNNESDFEQTLHFGDSSEVTTMAGELSKGFSSLKH